MKFDRSRPGALISGVVHVGLLGLTLVAFSDTQKFEDASEAMPVEVISESQLSQITQGEKTAKQAQPTPKPRVDRVAEREETKPEALDLKRDVPTPPSRPEMAEPIPTPPERPREAEAEKARAEAEAKAAAEAQKAAEARAVADAKAAAEAQARAKAEAAAKAAAAAAAAEAKAKAAAQAKAAEEAQEALERAAEAKAQADAKAKAEADAKAKAVAEAKAKAEAEAKAKALAEAKAEADAKARAVAEAEAKRKEEARLKAEQEAKILADMRKREAEAEAKRKEAEARQRAAEQQKLAAMAEQQAKAAAQRSESKFDPSNIDKLLQSREKPSQSGSTGRDLNRTASLGAPTANGPKLNPSQKDQLGALLKEQLAQCWSPPPGLANADSLKPRIRMSLKEDGSLSAQPVLANDSGDPAFRSMAESAIRAVRRCAPFKIPAQFAPFYSDWRDWNVTFDAKEMLS